MVKEYLINSDTILWNDFIKGNDDAFKVIYNNHIQSLYKFGSHFTHDTDLVKDCIHDVYIELAKYRKSLGTTNNIKLYLFKSLKRKIIKALAVKGNLATIDSENVPFYYTISAEEELVQVENEQLRYQQLDKAIATLSPRQKEAIYLKFVSDLSYEELGNLMQMNYQSARNLVYRGLEKLRESFPQAMFLFFLPVKRVKFKR